ncbi:MAG: hypothetical protein Q9170_007151 [Blastenia crenularia]
MAASTRQVLYLHLGDPMESSVFDDLYQGVRTQIATLVPSLEAKTLSTAQSVLSTQSFKAILAVDGGLSVRKYNDFQKSLASYVKQGGTLIFCCIFSGFVRPHDIAKLRENFEQP